MKVLLINNCHYRRGGADVVYLNTGELLSKNGHDVIYFSTKSVLNEPAQFSEYFIEDIDALKLSFTKQLIKTPRKLYSSESKNKLLKLIEKTKPDLAHIHLYKGGLTASILPVLKAMKIPAVITLHDFSLLCPRNIFLDGNDNICERCVTSHTINCVIRRCNRKNLFYSIVSFLEYEINNKLFRPENYFDKIICVCRFNMEKHQTRPKLNDRLVHIYNFYPDQDSTLPVNKRGNYFLVYGRLSKEKGINTLIEAWKKLDNQYILKIAGDGNLFQPIKQKIQNDGINNIELLGYKKGNELKTLISDASYIIVPSECNENNPMTIIEGYSLGKPVIGSRVGGIPEILTDNQTGFLFEMKNIDDLVSKVKLAFSSSDDKYKIMSKNARKFSEEHFSERTHLKYLIDVYSEVINNYNLK